MFSFHFYVTCRRHHCPHEPLGLAAFSRQRLPCTLSEYKETYKAPPEDCHRSESFKPQPRPQSSHAKLETTSTCHSDYQGHEARLPTPPKAAVYMPPVERFWKRGDTEYGEEYPEKRLPVPVKTLYPHDRIRRPTARLDSETEVRKQFREWPLPRKQLLTASWTRAQTCSAAPMDLKTTTATAHDRKDAKRPELARPLEGLVRSTVPLSKETVHKVEYVSKNVPVEFARAPPSEVSHTKAAFKTVSTTHSTYQEFPGDHRAVSCKPTSNTQWVEGGFDAKTTYAIVFQPPSLPKPYEHRSEVYQPPKAKFEGKSTHERTYVDHGICSVRGTARPPSRLRTRSEPLLTVTTHKHAYREWVAKPREVPQQVTASHHPPGKFYGESTMKSDFQGTRGELRESFKPPNAADLCQEPFPKNTAYREEYGKKKVEVCPVLKLQRPQSASSVMHTFSHKANGHMFYAPVTATVSHIDLSRMKQASK